MWIYSGVNWAGIWKLEVNGPIDYLYFVSIDYLSPKGELVILYKTLFVWYFGKD